MNTIFVSKPDELHKFYADSSLTLEGLALDSLNDYADWLSPFCDKEDLTFYIVKGELMNRVYNTDYPDDLHIVVVMLEKLHDLDRLAIKRFECGASWFDDICDIAIKRFKCDRRFDDIYDN